MFKTVRTACLISLALLPAFSAFGAGITPKIIFIKAGRLIDVENNRVLSDQAIVVEGERIKSVSPLASATIPAGAQVIDLSTSTVLPGLIDAHTHLTGDATAGAYKGLGVSVPRAALYGARSARVTLEAGFTTVRNVGAEGYSDVALRDAINDGDIIGPRMLVSGPALGITGGHCDENLLAPEFKFKADAVADGPWAIRAKVREVVKYGANLIKFCATGGVLSKGDQPGTEQYTLEEMKALVEEAHKLERKVAAHAHGTQGIKDAISAGVDSIEHASLIDEEGIGLAKAKGTYLVMDIYDDDYILQEGEKVGMLPESLEKERKLGQLQRNNFEKAWKGGATMAFGTDAGVYPHGDNAKQFFYMVKYGMTPLEAIHAATFDAATLLGLQKEVGSIAPSKFADIIAVSSDPLKNVTALEKVSFVMKGGQVYKKLP